MVSTILDYTNVNVDRVKEWQTVRYTVLPTSIFKCVLALPVR